MAKRISFFKRDPLDSSKIRIMGQRNIRVTDIRKPSHRPGCYLQSSEMAFIIYDSWPFLSGYQAWFRTTDPINAFHPENLTYLRTAIVLWTLETTPAIIHWFQLPCKSDQTRHCEEPVRATWQSSTPGVQFIYFWELLRIRVRYTNRKHNNTDHFCGDRRH